MFTRFSRLIGAAKEFKSQRLALKLKIYFYRMSQGFALE